MILCGSSRTTTLSTSLAATDDVLDRAGLEQAEHVDSVCAHLVRGIDRSMLAEGNGAPGPGTYALPIDPGALSDAVQDVLCVAATSVFKDTNDEPREVFDGAAGGHVAAATEHQTDKDENNEDSNTIYSTADLPPVLQFLYGLLIDTFDGTSAELVQLCHRHGGQEEILLRRFCVEQDLPIDFFNSSLTAIHVYKSAV